MSKAGNYWKIDVEVIKARIAAEKEKKERALFQSIKYSKYKPKERDPAKILVQFEYIEEEPRSPLYNLIYPKEMKINNNKIKKTPCKK